MRRYLPFVAALLLIPSIAAAQSTTEDGIRALLREDYQAAARILRPLAESDDHPDPVAQFLMAILYDTGRGVERNPGRGCGLFLSAASRDNPFMQQSSVISYRIRDELGSLGPFLCVSGTTRHDVDPVTITLGPNHQVVVKETSITVEHDGEEQRIVTAGCQEWCPFPFDTQPSTSRSRLSRGVIFSDRSSGVIPWKESR